MRPRGHGLRQSQPPPSIRQSDAAASQRWASASRGRAASTTTPIGRAAIGAAWGAGLSSVRRATVGRGPSLSLPDALPSASHAASAAGHLPVGTGPLHLLAESGPAVPVLSGSQADLAGPPPPGIPARLALYRPAAVGRLWWTAVHSPAPIPAERPPFAGSTILGVFDQGHSWLKALGGLWLPRARDWRDPTSWPAPHWPSVCLRGWAQAPCPASLVGASQARARRGGA